MTDIILPISLGEALDKLTILDIKLDKILDDRKNNIKIEYDVLYNILNSYINKFPLLYKSLKKINEYIWDMMNDLRDGSLDDNSYLPICKKTILYNDIRFRIKNKINILHNSKIKEEKGYNCTIFTVNIINYDNINELIEPLLYLSFKYDKVIIKSSINIDIINEYFKYDKFIVFDNNITNYSLTINENLSNDELYSILNINDLKL
jgi:hypothetical protein